ncbi:kinase domain protein (macronuclear) [Tetrahymena thermophila SB210]|uniref:Kinase domain protein n=1 Tax=Tetrahymena thermophila (strain SB210) TaxID=312017 RepID=W7XCD0_TETTS|nr:kinase domain protein [Tetrahymena thermophila SB210]EWS74203.1 kinase domain protein [Tetrahymena thermophila SB210]|eukprot:XP_012653263.1 kinase domain protein [Tetrahymena thermophila SB210]
MSSESASKLVSDLTNSAKIQNMILYFSSNQIYDDNLKDLSSHLHKFTNLETLALEFSVNSIGAEGAIGFSSAIRQCNQLRFLELYLWYIDIYFFVY